MTSLGFLPALSFPLPHSNLSLPPVHTDICRGGCAINNVTVAPAHMHTHAPTDTITHSASAARPSYPVTARWPIRKAFSDEEIQINRPASLLQLQPTNAAAAVKTGVRTERFPFSFPLALVGGCADSWKSRSAGRPRFLRKVASCMCKLF